LQDELNRQDFDQLIDISSQALSDRAYQALEWVPRIPVSKIDSYEASARKDGFRNFVLKERMAGNQFDAVIRDRAEYFPVFYVYPLQGNEGALGFDLGSNPARLRALKKARDTNTVVASSRINLVQTPNDPAGVLIFSPVYKNGSDLTTVELRRQGLLGFVLGVFRIGRMVDVALNSFTADRSIRKPAGIDVYLFDGGVEGEPVPVYVHNSRSRKGVAPSLAIAQARKGIFLEHGFLVGGRKWSLIARPTNPSLATKWYTAAAATSVAILMISFLSAIFFTTIARQNQQVRILVDQRTSEMKEASQRALISEARVRTVVETVVDGIITFDEFGVIDSINPAAADIFRYDEANLVGSKVWVLMPQPWHDEYEEYLRIYRSSGDTTIVGTGREIQGLRGDGHEFPLEIGISEMMIAGQRMFTAVVRDITEKKLAETMKSEFVSTVSHELRTPLTSIKGSLGLIRAGVAGELPDKLNVMLEIAYKNSERLVLLINDILDIEKIEAGKMDFSFTDINLWDLVDEAATAHGSYATEHGVRINLVSSRVEAKIRGDYSRLMQVLANLLSNAAKFSGKSDMVDVRLETRGDMWRISVTDHGVGIPDNFRGQVFQRFSQADSSDTRKIGGTGLGLSICQAIVEKHQGVIDFSSEIGKGSTFWIELPAARQTTKGVIALKTENNILVCEDDTDTSRVLAVMLADNGYHIDVARSADEVRRKLETGHYVAMTLDLDLPDQDCISLLQELKDASNTRDLPIVVVSANADEKARLYHGSSDDVVDWIAKPVDPGVLMAAINRGVHGSIPEKPRVLHVEDDSDVLVILSALAEDFCVIDSAENLNVARQKLSENKYDLVILDLALPDGSGEEIFSQLRTQDGQPIPVIIFSAQEVTPELAENVKAVLVKSQTSNEVLLATVRSAIGTESIMA
jgi:PAS domain S-box-containing protein